MERSSGAAPPLSSEWSGGPDDGQTLSFLIEPVGTSASMISLKGELDLNTIPRLEKQLFDQLRTRAGVIVELTGVSFIDSSGIGLLIRALRSTGRAGALHTVIAEGSQVDRVFSLAGIDRVMPIFSARAPALEALNGAAGS